MLILAEPTKVVIPTKSSKGAITLLDLPKEILDMIANLLSERQLPELRLISKHAWLCLSDNFAKVKFAHLRHHFTEPSLQDLVHITSHPTFSKCVKSIEFSTARTKNPSNWRIVPGIPNPLPGEDCEFRQNGTHINMLVTVLENLKHNANHKVSLGVFDSFNHRMLSESKQTEHVLTLSKLLGHGYVKSYGEKNVLTGTNPYGTMFAVSRATEISGYSLQRISITSTVSSRTESALTRDRQSNVLLQRGTNQFKPNLTFKLVLVSPSIMGHYSMQNPYLALEVQTSASSHLSLESQNSAPEFGPFQEFTDVGYYLSGLSLAFTETKYQKFTLKNLQIRLPAVTWLSSRMMKQPFEDLDFSGVILGVKYDANSHKSLAITFLNHFKENHNIKTLRIANLVLVMDTLAARENDYQSLRLGAREIVAEGRGQVQSVLKDLIAQIST
ncbi:hypothetical protein QM012_000161 [Aureobasidium pullulans]|uniref:F-box domain-containing protein n=1 Tax=Aureobasidium pullulans TaxID=5580 RepID=A0ABR0TV19_AURPU